MANINTELEQIRKAVYGREVRSSIANAIELINKEQVNTSTAQTNLDSKFNQLIINAGNSNAEVVAARVKADGTQFDTLSKRLDKGDEVHDALNNEVISSRTDSKNVVHKNLKSRLDNFDAQLDTKTKHFLTLDEYKNLIVGDDYTNALQKGIEDSSKHGIPLMLNDKEYTFTELTVWNGCQIIGSSKYKTILKHTGSGNAITNKWDTSCSNLIIENLTIKANENTTNVLDLRKCNMSKVKNIAIDMTTGGLNGLLFGRINESDTHSVYYNYCECVQISGKVNRTEQHGFILDNIANSNTFINCRTNYITNAVVIKNSSTNNNSFFGCHFEQFNTAVEINGFANNFIGCRMEDNQKPTKAIGYLINSGGTRNTFIATHNTGIKTLIEDKGTIKSLMFEFFKPDKTGIQAPYLSFKNLIQETGGRSETELNMGGWGVVENSYIKFKYRESYKAPTDGELAIFNNTGQPNAGEGLYYKVESSQYWQKAQVVRSGTTPERPTKISVGEMYFDKTLQKPIWWTGTNWKDANGGAV